MVQPPLQWQEGKESLGPSLPLAVTPHVPWYLSLRFKGLSTLVIVLFLSLFVSGIVVGTTVRESYQRAEGDLVKEAAHRLVFMAMQMNMAIQILTNEIAKSRGLWDFVQDPQHSEYLEEVFTDSHMQRLNVHHVVIMTNNGSVLFETSHSIPGWGGPVVSLSSLLDNSSTFLENGGGVGCCAMFGPFSIAAFPIGFLENNRNNIGWLITARYWASIADSLLSIAQVCLALQCPSVSPTESDLTRRMDYYSTISLGSPDPEQVRTLRYTHMVLGRDSSPMRFCPSTSFHEVGQNEDRAVAYLRFVPPSGAEILMRFDVSRHVRVLGDRTLSILFYVCIVAATVTAIWVTGTTEIMTVRPITRLLKDLRGIREGEEGNLNLKGHRDEIQALRVAINSLLQNVRQGAQDHADAESRANFINTLSHELRNPLHAVIGMLSIFLEKSDLSGEDYENMRFAQLSADYLLTLINNTLDYSKLKAGKLVVNNELVDARSIVEDVVMMFSPMATSKGLTLKSCIPDETSCFLWGDDIRIRQVLINLVSNALKFTNEGDVKVHLCHENDPATEDRLRFAVEDSGDGIQESDLASLFQNFAQVGNHAPKGFAGTGLGLSIAKELVHLMGGGTISVESEVGHGSVFYFSIPINCSCSAPPPNVGRLSRLRSGRGGLRSLPRLMGQGADDKAQVSPYCLHALFEEECGRKARILVVEDDLISRRVTLSMLRAYECDIASDGLQAITAASQQDYDVIVMDWNMPNCDGLTATRRIRELEREKGCRRCPIVGLSANVGPGPLQACLEAGMDDLASKPIKQAELVERITRFL